MQDKTLAPLWSRLDNGDPGFSLRVFDHHLASPDDLDGSEVVVEPVGACATLLVEQLMEREIALTPPEATALALGIHADTGSLTYQNTTARDVHAAAYAMEQAADLLTLRHFLHPSMNEVQLQLLTRLLTESATVGEYNAAILPRQAL